MRPLTALAFALAMTACQAPGSEAQTPSSGDATQQVAESAGPSPTATAVVSAPAATLADAVEDVRPSSLDASYEKAKLRPEYARCIKASGGVVPDIQDCQAEELAWHQARLRAALAKVDESPSSEFKDKVDEEQAAYMKDTDTNCTWNPDEDGQGRMLDAESCRINRYANRADAIEATLSR
jgi:hypothetical protein